MGLGSVTCRWILKSEDSVRSGISYLPMDLKIRGWCKGQGSVSCRWNLKSEDSISTGISYLPVDLEIRG